MRKTPLRSRSAPLRSREPARGKPIKKVNRKRKAANLERAHGPAERREWIKTLPCANCGIVGYSEGAHIRNGGMSRKADMRFVIPLCGWHGDWTAADSGFLMSCHGAQHAYGWAELPNLDTLVKREVFADGIENLWQSHLRQTGRARQDTE